MFKCECGHIFEEPKVVHESRGEFWGAPCWEKMYYCPHCGSDCFDEYDEYEDEEDEEDE